MLSKLWRCKWDSIIIDTTVTALNQLSIGETSGLQYPEEDTDQTTHTASPSAGFSIPVPKITDISIPVPSTTGLVNHNSMSHITDHPLISKTAYETAV